MSGKPEIFFVEPGKVSIETRKVDAEAVNVDADPDVSSEPKKVTAMPFR